MEWVFLLMFGCGQSEPETVVPWEDATCERLYGEPGENTGLDDEGCVPRLAAGDGRSWEPQAWSVVELAGLASWSLENPVALLGADPYQDEGLVLEPPEGAVCGMHAGDSGSYRLETYDSESEAWQAGASITHGGACGACSSLVDLGVYASVSDLTTPVRSCALANFGGDAEANIDCLRGVGFTEACAEIWHYNTVHTREACLEVCLSALDEPYHSAEGELNACIACDEEQSGPVFKAVAGRTRRNSGLATALCRPCETVWRIEHDYR